MRYEDLIGNYATVIVRYGELRRELGPELTEFPRLLKMENGLVHGMHHWVRVGIYGLAIAGALRAKGRVKSAIFLPDGALEDAVLLACFFHDCARVSEGSELVHGREGNRVWVHYAERKGFAEDLKQTISQALLFHVDHPAVDPAANEVTISLCNADRLDRVRLGEPPDPARMYDDGVWRDLAPFSDRLLAEVRQERVMEGMERRT
jgi:HD superfamily phosphodiesterase